jgi:hypothetical protein
MSPLIVASLVWYSWQEPCKGGSDSLDPAGSVTAPKNAFHVSIEDASDHEWRLSVLRQSEQMKLDAGKSKERQKEESQQVYDCQPSVEHETSPRILGCEPSTRSTVCVHAESRKRSPRRLELDLLQDFFSRTENQRHRQ